MRASELWGLTMENLDVVGKRATVLGKGNKHRPVFFSRATGRVLNAYLRGQARLPTDPVFVTEKRSGFSPNSLRQMIERLGWHAHIEATRCSPHTFRHTAAIWFLRNAGNVFSLQQMLGHEDLKVTSRYCASAEADVQGQHMLYSPVQRLKGGRK